MVNTFAIPFALLLLYAIFLWVIINVPGRWWLKLAAMIAVLVVSVSVWKSLDSYRGWPIPCSSVHGKAVFLGYIPYEPDPRTGDPGAIYLLVKPEKVRGGLLGYKPGVHDHLTCQMPYSRQAHENASKAQEITSQGGEIEIDFDVTGKGKGGQGGISGSGNGQVPGEGVFSNGPGSPKFYQLPPRKLIPKPQP